MAGFLISAAPKQTVDFAGLGVGLSQELILADLVDILHWREATVLVKVYASSIGGSAGYIVFGALSRSLSEQDPAVEFIDRSAFPSAFVDGTTSAPTFLSFVAPPGPLIRILAQGTRLAAGPLSATVSIEVSVKDA